VYHDVHHLIELSGGGRTVMSNLVTICKTCHARRHPHLRKAGYGKTKRPFK
jgi:5-methylcytosine-specific restriction endonuclease McrA